MPLMNVKTVMDVTNNGAGSMIWDDIIYICILKLSQVFFPLLPPSSLEELLL